MFEEKVNRVHQIDTDDEDEQNASDEDDESVSDGGRDRKRYRVSYRLKEKGKNGEYIRTFRHG